jgi:hypothetical protein
LKKVKNNLITAEPKKVLQYSSIDGSEKHIGLKAVPGRSFSPCLWELTPKKGEPKSHAFLQGSLQFLRQLEWRKLQQLCTWLTAETTYSLVSLKTKLHTT